jgi:ferredoxin-NADP reductase/uncharacterized protein YcbX
MRPVLHSIVRYPVKGLNGVPETKAELQPGRGLAHDRMLAIENGTAAAVDRGGWNPRETFFHLAKNEDVARLTTDLADGVLTLGFPNGHVGRVRLDDEHFGTDASTVDGLLGDVLPHGPLGAPRLIRTGIGLWDWPQAHLSIINIATIEALSEAAGVSVDPRRFRGNLLVSGLPAWGELDLLGRRIRIGDSVLEVFQPTDRCRATTVDPESALSDLNVPGLLASRFGHMFCGVYARVIEGGAIELGHELKAADAPLVTSGLTVKASWPRTARIVDVRRENDSVTSLWLRDAVGLAPTALPGQHVRLHLVGARAPAWRCYTVSGVHGDLVRISVKRGGRVSSALHDQFAVDDSLLITGPFGSVTLDRKQDDDLVLLSAGVGITPTIAMLRSLVAEESTRRVRIVHVDRSAVEVALWSEVLEACRVLENASAELFLTRDTEQNRELAGARPGRPTASDLAVSMAGLDAGRVTAYACGPDPFTRDIRSFLEAWGLPHSAVHVERFFSPSTAELVAPKAPSTAGPHRVSVGTTSLEWVAASGSILDAVEGAGIDWPSGCRSGACGTCVRTLRAGTIEYLIPPLSPPDDGDVLTCCSAPTSDLVFESPTGHP